MMMFEDVTSTLRKCRDEMNVGEMLKDENFTLEKAMSAMELMDPKMDSGMSDPPSKTLSETTFEYVFTTFFFNHTISRGIDIYECCCVSIYVIYIPSLSLSFSLSLYVSLST